MKTKGSHKNSPRTVVICRVCGVDIFTTERAVETGRSQYCSKQCRDKGLSKLMLSRRGQVVDTGKKCLCCGQRIICEVNASCRKFCTTGCRVEYWENIKWMAKERRNVKHE